MARQLFVLAAVMLLALATRADAQAKLQCNRILWNSSTVFNFPDLKSNQLLPCSTIVPTPSWCQSPSNQMCGAVTFWTRDEKTGLCAYWALADSINVFPTTGLTSACDAWAKNATAFLSGTTFTNGNLGTPVCCTGNNCNVINGGNFSSLPASCNAAPPMLFPSLLLALVSVLGSRFLSRAS